MYRKFLYQKTNTLYISKTNIGKIAPHDLVRLLNLFVHWLSTFNIFYYFPFKDELKKTVCVDSIMKKWELKIKMIFLE